MAAYYNERDPYAAAWLRNLISAGHIAPGDVDERSIEDVLPIELAGYTQCHFFAGIGVWSYALRRAGWPDNRPVWTGSCPCQPFSAAGKGGGFADERHLWPAWFHLIGVRKPAIVLGEQVASKDGLAWFDIVHADMEAAGYAIAGADLCAAGVGAPHIRQRLWFVGVADAEQHEQRERRGSGREGAPGNEPELEPGRRGDLGRLANADGGNASPERQQRGGQYGQQPEDGGTVGLADAIVAERQDRQPGKRDLDAARGRDESSTAVAGLRGGSRPGPTNGHWRAADWLYCRDGKWRPVEPGTFPLADGVANRVGRLRAYGNAIVAEAAQAFIESVM